MESLAADLAIALHAEDVMVKRMPGESAVGIFVPNATRTSVFFRDTVANTWKSVASIPLNLGVTYLNQPIVEDLAVLPHLLIAGSTGSGKSTLISSILAALICKKTSKEVRLCLGDTSNVEFGHFIGCPHLLFKPAINTKEVLDQMEWIIREMGVRLGKLSNAGVRNIHEYNASRAPGQDKLPFIVFVLDELATLLGDKSKPDPDGKGPTYGKIAESTLGNIVAGARKTGCHVIAATQRPSVNVVSGSIKTNFPARLSFRLTSDADSRTVLSTGGAEHLLSLGDMLYISPTRPGLQRLHAPFATIEDIKFAVQLAEAQDQKGA